jgi:hypothetical protein
MIMPRRHRLVPTARRRKVGPVIVVVHGRHQCESIGRAKCRVINHWPGKCGANHASAREQAKAERCNNEKAVHCVLHLVFDGCRMECRQGALAAELPSLCGSL